jgi:hypothetical protein
MGLRDVNEIVEDKQASVTKLLDRLVDLIEMEQEAIEEGKWTLAKAVRTEQRIVRKEFEAECDGPTVVVVE